jgi:hypothetical protein
MSYLVAVRTRGSALTLLLIVGVAAGCGHENGVRQSRSDYLDRIREIEAGPDARSADRLFFELVIEPGLPKEDCLAKARELDGHLHDVVEEVDALRPPAAIQSLQDRFVSAAKTSVGEVDQAVGEVEAGRLACGIPMNRRIYGLPSTRRAVEVLDELSKKGYRIGLNSD